MKDFILDRVQVTTTFDLYCNTEDAEKVGNWLTSTFPKHRRLRSGPQVKDMRVVKGRTHYVVELPGVHDKTVILQQIEDL